jgi:hypothetical protein
LAGKEGYQIKGMSEVFGVSVLTLILQ